MKTFQIINVKQNNPYDVWGEFQWQITVKTTQILKSTEKLWHKTLKTCPIWQWNESEREGRANDNTHWKSRNYSCEQFKNKHYKLKHKIRLFFFPPPADRKKKKRDRSVGWMFKNNSPFRIFSSVPPLSFSSFSTSGSLEAFFFKRVWLFFSFGNIKCEGNCVLKCFQFVLVQSFFWILSLWLSSGWFLVDSVWLLFLTSSHWIWSQNNIFHSSRTSFAHFFFTDSQHISLSLSSIIRGRIPWMLEFLMCFSLHTRASPQNILEKVLQNCQFCLFSFP